MTDHKPMTQTAPYPQALAHLVKCLRYREHLGWKIWLDDDLQRDKPGRHTGESRGMTLVVQRHGPDTYHPPDPDLVEDALIAVDGAPGDIAALQTLAEVVRAEREKAITVNHYFAVPPATYNRASWQRWLLDRLGDVDTHERMEDFALWPAHEDGTPFDKTPRLGFEPKPIRPYSPNHGPGQDPYRVCEYAEDIDRRTSFRGEVNPE
jgi:hypothetical protein